MSLEKVDELKQTFLATWCTGPLGILEIRNAVAQGRFGIFIYHVFVFRKVNGVDT